MFKNGQEAASLLECLRFCSLCAELGVLAPLARLGALLLGFQCPICSTQPSPQACDLRPPSPSQAGDSPDCCCFSKGHCLLLLKKTSTILLNGLCLKKAKNRLGCVLQVTFLSAQKQKSLLRQGDTQGHTIFVKWIEMGKDREERKHIRISLNHSVT